MEKKRMIVYISIVVIISLVTSFIFYYVFFSVTSFELSECPYMIWISQTKNDDNYTINIRHSSPPEIDTNELYWHISDQNDVLRFENDFPTHSGEEGSVSNKNITVIWYDHDLNGKLSKNDNIIIKSENYNLTGYTFKIGQIWDKYTYETISNIILE